VYGLVFRLDYEGFERILEEQRMLMFVSGKQEKAAVAQFESAAVGFYDSTFP
jgi:hypothetical protein